MLLLQLAGFFHLFSHFFSFISFALRVLLVFLRPILSVSFILSDLYIQYFFRRLSFRYVVLMQVIVTDPFKFTDCHSFKLRLFLSISSILFKF